VNNLFPLFYLGTIEYYAELIKHKSIVFEQFENFPKQTYRSRCEIAGPNGRQKLMLPVLKIRSTQLAKNAKISNTDDWQKIHWKSLEAAYRASPYFEYYENEFHPFYHEKYVSVFEFNLALHQVIIRLLQVENSYTLSTAYTAAEDTDYRDCFSCKKESPNTKLKDNSYIQVFTDRLPFLHNLSILDLLFNEGPNAVGYLKRISTNA
jgi:hypothetical protein